MKSFKLFAVFPGLVLLVTQAFSAEPAPVEVKVAGLQVIRELIPRGPGGMGFSLTPFRSFEKRGVKLALLLTAPRGEFAGFDFPRCGVQRLADDKGNPLRIWPINRMDAEITDNRRYAMIEIASTGLPARDAKNILAKGTIGVFLGSKTATARGEPTVIRKNARIRAGKYEFTVFEIKEEKEYVTSWRVRLKIPGRHREIRSLQLLEKTETGFNSTSNSGRGGGGEDSHFMFYFTDREMIPEPLTLIVEVWSDLKPVAVPFDIEVGAGL